MAELSELQEGQVYRLGHYGCSVTVARTCQKGARWELETLPAGWGRWLVNGAGEILQFTPALKVKLHRTGLTVANLSPEIAMQGCKRNAGKG